MSDPCQGADKIKSDDGARLKMYYATILLLLAIILFLGWPRAQTVGADEKAALELLDKKVEQLTLAMAVLGGRLEALESAQVNQTGSTRSNGPLSGKGLANYQEIQRDWIDGASIQELCQRYQLLQGEIELILDLLDGRN